MQKKQNYFGVKYRNKKNITEMLNRWITRKKRIKRIQKRPRIEHALTKNNTHENTKLKITRPRWNTWIQVLKLEVHPRKTSLATESMLIRIRHIRIDDERKNTMIQKDPKKGPSQKTIDRLCSAMIVGWLNVLYDISTTMGYLMPLETIYSWITRLVIHE